MINKQMKYLIEGRKNVDANDDIKTDEYWEKELEVLCVSLDDTIEYINNAPQEEIEWCAEIWEDLSAYWKSPELIESMINCQKKYPDIAKLIQVNIDYARKALKNDC